MRAANGDNWGAYLTSHFGTNLRQLSPVASKTCRSRSSAMTVTHGALNASTAEGPSPKTPVFRRFCTVMTAVYPTVYPALAANRFRGPTPLISMSAGK